jgi:hypothetical protein
VSHLRLIPKRSLKETLGDVWAGVRAGLRAEFRIRSAAEWRAEARGWGQFWTRLLQVEIHTRHVILVVLVALGAYLVVRLEQVYRLAVTVLKR